MYGDNKLWAGHRIILPEVRDKAVHRCRECRFFVTIQGLREMQQGCVISIEAFRKRWWRVPKVIPISQLLQTVGKEGLAQITTRGNPDAQACADFQAK
jgi:hypothetical protein